MLSAFLPSQRANFRCTDECAPASRLRARVQVRGAQRAQSLYRANLDECRRLRANNRRLSEQRGAAGTLATSGFELGDRVLFVRREQHLTQRCSSSSSTSASSPVASSAADEGPSYVALREAEGGGAPCFLARASEESLCRTLRCTYAALPTVAVGKVVHIERLHSPRDVAAAAALGVRPGAAYGIITAEMTDDLAPEVQGRRCFGE